MFRNFLKIATRNILRNKLYSIINISGLVLGICACITIYLIVHHEFSFDKHHAGHERIFRVMTDYTESTGDLLHFNRVSPEVATIGRTAFRGVEKWAGVIPYNAKITVGRLEFESTVPGSPYRSTAITEPEYFSLFQYKWLAGNKDALHLPFNVVLTESRARQYFGDIALKDMIGRQVVYEDSLITSVAGVVADPEENTDLLFTDFISYSTILSGFLEKRFVESSWNHPRWSAWVFAKLENGTAATGINEQLNALVKTRDANGVKLKLEPLSMMHFNADLIENPVRTAHKPTLYSLVAIAIFILLLAVINFINLSTAQSLQRAKEVGIRKVLGSRRPALVLQFMIETVLLTLVAVILAASLVNPVLGAFSSFTPAGISFDIFDGATLLFLAGIILITTMTAGLYPARVISSQLPVWNLKQNAFRAGGEKWWLRKGLIVFQFAVSLLFIISSLVIAKQITYTREKDLGFTPGAIITLESPRGEDMKKLALLQQSVHQLPNVQQVARQWLSPMSDNPRGMKLKFKSTDANDFWVTQVAGNENFIPLYNIRLLAGRNLAAADSVNEFVINESMSKLMGDKNPQSSLNKILYWNDKPYPVVGVVADFHTASLHDPITPLCIINRPDREGALAVKFSGNISTVLSQLETSWKNIYPYSPFSYKFYDDTLAQLYEKDRQTATLINTSAAITIFISCIGLFGLALFTARKRAKEISIRKVLGAGVANIVLMLGKEFLVLVIIALLVAAPLAWYFMHEWLSGFTYRIALNGWVIVLSGILALAVATFTIGFQALKAAMSNPVKNLRSE